MNEELRIKEENLKSELEQCHQVVTELEKEKLQLQRYESMESFNQIFRIIPIQQSKYRFIHLFILT